MVMARNGGFSHKILISAKKWRFWDKTAISGFSAPSGPIAFFHRRFNRGFEVFETELVVLVPDFLVA